MERLRKVRYSNEPMAGRERPMRPLDVTWNLFSQAHLNILRLLTPHERYTYLPWPWMHALLGEWNPNAFNYRVRKMAEKPNNYLSRPPQQQPPGTLNTRHAVYTLAPAGAKALQIIPKRPPHEYDHQLIQDVTKASIELGCRNHGLRFLDWSYFKDNDRIPEATRNAATPWNIPIGDKAFYEPDGPPVVVGYLDDNYRYLFTEIDRGTEPLTAKNPKRRNITRLFEEIGTVMRDRLYASHFDFDSALFLIVTISPLRMKTMMEIAASVLGKPAYLLFKTTEEWQRDANDKLFTQPWKRIGHPDLDLTKWSN